MTTSATLSRAPFGSNAARFPDKLSTSTSEELGPGRYEYDTGAFSAKAVARRASGPGWARAYELSHSTPLPYLLNKEEWEKVRDLPRKLGPGAYPIKDPIEASYSRGILSMREPRFKDDKSIITPGPGTYGEGGIPGAAIEKKMRNSFGSESILSGGKGEVRPATVVGSRLGPGTYNIPSTIDEFLHKKTGTQGPYKVFTLDRSKPVMTGHHGIAISHSVGPGDYNLKSTVDESLKSFSGKFKRAAQYPEYPIDRFIISNLALNPRDRREPGPGHYDPSDSSCRPISQSAAHPAFMSSSQRTDRRTTQDFTKNYNSVGPGRYDVQRRSNVHNVNGSQSVFKSKTDRPSGIQLRALNERLAAKNLSFPRDHVLLLPS